MAGAQMKYLTPEQAAEKKLFPTIEDATRAAKNRRKCQCGRPVWRLAQTNLCFTCTTGESDSSDDYELTQL